MKKNKQTNALRTVLRRLNYGLLSVCMVLGLGISEIQAQFVSPANFYNQVDGVLTNEVDVSPGDTINYLVGVNSEGGIDGVTITMNFDANLMYIQDSLVIDEVGPLFGYALPQEVRNWQGYFTFSKAILGSFYQGSTVFMSVNLIISSDITESTTTTIDHILDDLVALRSQIALYGNALVADADAPSLTINIIVPEVYDCPTLEANFGDACDDEDDNTENDVVTEDCECLGTPAASLNGSVTWNPACDERNATVKLYEPSTATEVASYDVSVQADGTFNIPSVEIGTFDVIVNVEGYLAKGIQDVVFASGGNNLVVGAIVFGDFNNDNVIGFQDAAISSQGFFTEAGQPGYSPLEDYNCDGQIDFADVSVFSESFQIAGDTAPLGN